MSCEGAMDRRAQVSSCCTGWNDVRLGRSAGSSAFGAEGTKLDFKRIGQPILPSHFTLTLSRVTFGMLGKSATKPIILVMVVSYVVSQSISDPGRSVSRYRHAVFSLHTLSSLCARAGFRPSPPEHLRNMYCPQRSPPVLLSWWESRRRKARHCRCLHPCICLRFGQ